LSACCCSAFGRLKTNASLPSFDSANTIRVSRYEKGVKKLLPRLTCAHSAAVPSSRPFAFFGSIAHCLQPEPELTVQPLSSVNATSPLGVSLPVNATALQAMLSRSRASLFGFGKQVMSDRLLRSSRELLSSQLHLPPGFRVTLDGLRRSCGVS
jgi:hypothetical protein